MASFKEQLGRSQPVVERLYDWEESKRQRESERRARHTPSFTPQLPRSSGAFSSPARERAAQGSDWPVDAVDRCFEWQHNREAWLNEKRAAQVRRQQMCAHVIHTLPARAYGKAECCDYILVCADSQLKPSQTVRTYGQTQCHA
jgi:hypothetical protein